MTEWDQKQVDNWEQIFRRVSELMAEYGSEYYSKRGDYLLVEDNYGWQRISLSVQNLKMLMPEIIHRLRKLLTELPDWEIVIAVDIPGKEKDWPPMGVTIRKHEIIDGLQRQYFPEELRDLHYAGSKQGTGYD